MVNLPHPQPDVASFWQATGGSAPDVNPLVGDTAADIAIIGGGYTALSTAQALMERGVDVIVLEANRAGWGASGRNGGVVSGKFRLTFAEMARRWDVATARRMHALGVEAIETVDARVREFNIDADWRPHGSLRCAHRPEALAALRVECDWLHDTLGDRAVSMIDRDQVAAETGSSDFLGGMLNTHGGVIHPLRYHRGWLAGLRARGLRYHDATLVQGLERGSHALTLHAATGARVTARQVLLATNGYSDLSPATTTVRRKVVPFRSAMLATEPLVGNAAEGLLSTDRSYTETRRMMRWFRRIDGRLLYGGRGAFGRADSAAAFDALERAMRKQFPQLDGLAITHRWSGLVAMTMDSLPHVTRLDERVVAAMGYNGTGVAMASHVGSATAALLLGETADLGLIGHLPHPDVPLYPARDIGVRLVAGWYQFLDAMGR